MSWLQVADAVLALAGSDALIIGHLDRPWQTSTFSGRKHVFTLDFAGNDAAVQGEAFIKKLPDHKFDFRGQLVGDLAIVWTNRQEFPSRRLTTQFELLLIDEG